MEIRHEVEADWSTVAQLTAEAHGHAEVAALVDQLRPTLREPNGLSLVAEDQGQVVGHVMFSEAWLDAAREVVTVSLLSPVSVEPDRQREGIGSALIGHGIEILTKRSAPAVFLEGHPSYYPRFGFVAGGDIGFRKPSLRIPDAAFQVLLLSAYESWMTGTLVYPDVFWRLDCVGLRDV